MPPQGTLNRRVTTLLTPAALGTLVCALAWPANGQAQDAAPQALPEVTVTAERVETVLGRTPVSVTVIGRQEIERRSIYQLSDLAGAVAGVVVPNGFSNMPQAVGIRGVGVSLPAMSQAVGLYVDDAPLIRGYATAIWDLPDIERIEVLRGPQGTLYGQNTTAGAVKIVSLDPVATPGGWVQVGVGNHGAREARGYVVGAIGAGGALEAVGALGNSPLSASLALTHRENDGFARNDTLHQAVNRLDFTQFRAKLKYAPNADFDAVLAIDGLLDRSDTNTTNFPLNAPHAAPRVTYTSNTDGPFERQAGGAQLKLRQHLGPGLELRSITAWRGYQDDPAIGDYGGLTQARFGFDQQVQQDAYSQEFQWQKTGEASLWTLGLIAVHDDFDFRRWTNTFPLAASAPSYTEAWSKLATTDLGAYAQVRQALDDIDQIVVGLRAYRTEQTGSNEFWRTDAMHERQTLVYDAADLATRSSGVLPRVSLERQFDPTTFGYLSAAQGAKFGGYNRAANSLLAAEFATDPEHVTAYEAGTKWRMPSGRATAQLAVFYNDYRDYLASLTNATINGVQVHDTVLLNAGRAKTYGIDLDLTARLSDHLDWSASIEVLRSRFDAFASTASGANYIGNQLPYAPRLSAGSALYYTQAMARAGHLSLDLSVQYLSAQFSDAANAESLKVLSQTYVNLGAAFTAANHPWTVSLVMRNAFDRTQVLLRQTVPSLGVDSVGYNLPRTVMLSVRHDL